jgi:hypothetical protein
MASNGRRFKHIENQIGADRCPLLSKKTEWNQAVLYHFHSVRRQPNGDLNAFAIALFASHIAM